MFRAWAGLDSRPSEEAVVPNDERDADALVVGNALAVDPVGTPAVAVVGHEDDDRLPESAAAAKLSEQPVHAVIDGEEGLQLAAVE